MKILTVLLVVCVYAVLGEDDFTPEQLARVQSIKKRCVDEIGVDEKYIDKLKQQGVYEADEKFNCFAACTLKKHGVMRSNGAINRRSFTTTLKRSLPPKIVDDVKLCVAKVGKNGCQTGSYYLDCVKDTAAVELL